MAEIVDNNGHTHTLHDVPTGKINAGLKGQFWVNHLNCWETPDEGQSAAKQMQIIHLKVQRLSKRMERNFY